MIHTFAQIAIRFPDLPFRDQVWRITFEDGRSPAFVSVYNGEITGWSDNTPQELRDYSAPFEPRARILAARGMAFWYEGFNE